MDIEPAELAQIIGAKEVEVYLLRKQIVNLSAEVQQLKAKVESFNGGDSQISQDLSGRSADG